MTGIYFHIPFCAKKCPYCDFYSLPYRKEMTEQYVAAILRNIAAYTIEDTVDTLYFGGGTPSLLSTGQTERILDACYSHFCIADDAEITMEWNPTGNRSQQLRQLRMLGINRLSVGTQSFSDAQLKLLGRTHSAADGIRTVEDAFSQGFTNISCDLMLACPQQTESILHETLQTLKTLPVTHVSAYLLQVEEGTPLSGDTELLSRLPDEDTAADYYLQTVSELAEAGFLQYEVSSFAKEGFQSRHNLKYWKCQPYLGIGAGAHSCFNGRRFRVQKDAAAFCEAPVQSEILTDANPCSKEERLMLALRTSDGILRSELSEQAEKKLPMLFHAGYLQRKQNRIALTAEGFLMSNAVINALLS